MKKIISLLLALVMILSLSVTAFAADITQPDNGSKQVTGTYVAGATADTVYSVDISWGDMKFTYTGESAGTWDPSTHTTSQGTAAAWTVDTAATDTTLAGNQVKVTNHSNAAITATVVYESLAAYSAVTGSVTNGTMDLASAVETTLQNAPSATAELTLSGTLPETHSEGAQIGTITVTIAESTGGGQMPAEPITLTFENQYNSLDRTYFVEVVFYDAAGETLVTYTKEDVSEVNYGHTVTIPDGAVTFNYTHCYSDQGGQTTRTEEGISVPNVSSTIICGTRTTTPNA